MADKISLDKTYRTRDVRVVRLYAVDESIGAKPVIGVFRAGDDVGWVVSNWEINGASPGSHLDLIEVKPKRFVYINTYPSGSATMRETRLEADNQASNSRVACIRIELEEGRFDD